MIDATLSSIADPTRRRVVELLMESPRSSGELARATRVSPPAMSKHLRILRRSGLVSEQRSEADSRVRVYRLVPAPLAELHDWLSALSALWTDQLAAFKDYAERGAGE